MTPVEQILLTALVPIITELDVSRARQEATAIAAAHGFSKPAAYRMATAISELGNNIVFHAGEPGEIRLRVLRADGRLGLEAVAEDQGRGIDDIALAMLDGYSTGGGLGCGLPGCRRLVDEFEISSAPGKGACVKVRLWI